jgi:DNA-binding beta-propeller fold protein YncE
VGIAADPLGDFLFVTNGESESITVYRIDSASGVPTMVTGAPFPNPGMPCGVAADPMGRFLYVGNWASNDISCWHIERPTGTLLPVYDGFSKPNG